MTSSHQGPRRHRWWPWHRPAAREAAQPVRPTVPTLGGVGLVLTPGALTALVGIPPAAASRVIHTMAGLAADPAEAAPRASTTPPRARTALVFRTPGLRPELGVRENMLVDAATAGVRVPEERLTSLIAAAGLQDVDDLGAAALTPSEAVLVALVRALAPHPDCVLLDDSLDDLDPQEAATALALLHLPPRGTTVLLSTRRADIAALADRVAVIRDSRVAAEIRVPTEAAIRAVLRPPAARPLPDLPRADGGAPQPDTPAVGGTHAPQLPLPDEGGTPGSAPETSTGTRPPIDEGGTPGVPAGTPSAGDGVGALPRVGAPGGGGADQRPATGRGRTPGTVPPTTPYPESSPTWDEDPRTQEIALLAVARVRAARAAAARSAAAPDALREELGGDDLQDALDRLSPTQALTGTSAEVVHRARRILGDLHGPVMPEH